MLQQNPKFKSVNLKKRKIPKECTHQEDQANFQGHLVQQFWAQ